MTRLGKWFPEMRERGHGGFAQVYEATCRELNAPVAIKAFPRHRLFGDHSRARFENELRIMESVDHPFVVMFYNLLQDDTHFYVVMEHCASSLASLIDKDHGLPQYLLEKYACQLVSALHYLHRSLLVIHRDLSLDNLLIDNHDNLKIADFGLSKAVSDSDPLCTTKCGTRPYLAPEILRNEPYTEQVDIWQLGIVIYVMAFGCFPFCISNEAQMITEIQTKTPKFPEDVDLDLKDLLLKLLAKDPRDRLTIEQVVAHKWICKSEYYVLTDSRFACFQNLSSNCDTDDEISHVMKALGLPYDKRQKLGTDAAMVYRILKRREMSKRMNDGFTTQKLFLREKPKRDAGDKRPLHARPQSIGASPEELSVIRGVMNRISERRTSCNTLDGRSRCVSVRFSPVVQMRHVSEGSLLAKSCRFRAKNRII